MKKIISAIILTAFVLCGCGEKAEITPSPSPEATKAPTVEISMTAVGDNLIHSPIYKNALRRGGGTRYDFTSAYINIAEYIDSDINIINQETPIGGEELKISSYPSFNSPFELGEHMIDIGFNVINHANNHFYDAGSRGVINSMDFWRERDIPVIGVHSEGQDRIKYIDIKGITASLLAYTYGTNSGNPDPTYALNRLDRDTLKKDLKEARKNSDIVILSLHFGNEYELMSNAEQQEYAKIAAECNTDILIGHHPHVLQEVAEIKRSDGKIMPVYYSLGNFISSQDVAKCMIGGMVKAKFSGTPGNMTLKKSGFLPVITHFEANYANTRTFLFKDYNENLASQHGLKSVGFNYDYAQNLIESVIEPKYLENGLSFVH